MLEDLKFKKFPIAYKVMPSSKKQIIDDNKKSAIISNHNIIDHYLLINILTANH